ncbi:dihydrofolate reductase [Anaerobacterium chartisolvens]|uniref:Dihydrofolate reductase n=1 Tax=Anaerobacterium chartisolvens TaxID=1297424 RepID=A0A369B5W8_9FIRM|nr:dihydrofolate reductase [Anaerobacterium chartisolvens]RCX16912.1 dihydrofolate reductase [Anaerobacterium chartisolvens]
MISLIAAIGANGIIGRENRLPWKLPADLAYFKKTTMGHAVIMGRKTFESIGRPLPGRKNIILTRNSNFSCEGCVVCANAGQALNIVEEGDEAFVIGGASLYRELLPYADKLYLTFIDHAFEGDAVFPDIDYARWRLIREEKGPENEANPYTYYFRVYNRDVV